MKKLLHIACSPRTTASRSRAVAEAFIAELATQKPHVECETLDLSTTPLPLVTPDIVATKGALLAGKDVPDEHRDAWKECEKYIEHFLAADAYLVSTPMWNFSVPYTLKHYIDVIVQPKYLFHYTENGPEGLVTGKPLCLITARGGDYSKESPFHSYDMQEPFLLTVFGFIGITDISMIHAQPLDVTPELTEKSINEACDAARHAARTFDV